MKKPTNIGDKKAMQKAFIAKAGPNADVMRQMMDCTEGLYFYMKDADGRIMALNRNNCELCNIRDEEDAIGRTSAELFPHAFAKDYMDLDREVIATGQPIIKRVTEYPADKSFRLMESSVWPLKESEVPGPRADFIFAAISPCFVKISDARPRQPFIPASSAPLYCV